MLDVKERTYLVRIKITTHCYVQYKYFIQSFWLFTYSMLQVRIDFRFSAKIDQNKINSNNRATRHEVKRCRLLERRQLNFFQPVREPGTQCFRFKAFSSSVRRRLIGVQVLYTWRLTRLGVSNAKRLKAAYVPGKKGNWPSLEGYAIVKFF